ncbi:MAG: C2 family cysteine protease, partial [Flammeovirgaceae bacterium]
MAGWPSDPLVALTGFSSQKLYHQEETLENLWINISQSDIANCIMCTNTINNKDIEKLGLVLNHAYTLISAKETPDKSVKLIRVRNP